MNGATATALPLQAAEFSPCPAWCEHEADIDGLHQSEVHEVGDVLISLHQYFDGNLSMIGLCDFTDQEMLLTPEEAEQAAMILLRFARAARNA